MPTELMRRPAQQEARLPVEEPKERSVVGKIINDKVQRLIKAPVGTVSYTGLNLLVSLIPGVSFLIDDSMLARVAQKIDPGFKLMYDEEGRLNKNHYFENIANGLSSSDTAVRERTALLLSHLKKHVQQQAIQTGKTHLIVSPAKAQEAVKTLRMKHALIRENRGLLKDLGQLQQRNRFLRLAGKGGLAFHPQAKRSTLVGANTAAVKQRLKKAARFPSRWR